MTVVRRAIAYLAPHRRLVAGATVALLAQTALSLAPLYIVKALIDSLTKPSQSFAHVAGLAAVGVILAALGAIVGVARTWCVVRITAGVVAELRHELVHKLLGQSVAYYTGTSGGEVMSRVLNDVGAVERALGETAVGFLANGLMMLCCVVLMVVFEWRLGLVTMALVPVALISGRRASRSIFSTQHDVQLRLAAFTAHAQEVLSLSGVMLVKSFAREETEADRSASLTEELRVSQVRAAIAARWFSSVLDLLQLAAPVGLILAGAWLIAHHVDSLGTVLAFVTVLAPRFGMSLAGVGTGAVALLGTLPAWMRIFEVLDAEPVIRDRPGARSLTHLAGAVELDDVSFRYPGQSRPALDGVSLAVPPGQLVALVGPSGAGKSTLISLLTRFHDPDGGAVRFDGHDLRDVTLTSVAETVGVVLQETYLFHGSLRENLLYARPDAPNHELVAACREAQLDEVIAGLPDGLDTVVGERGYRLSGGERQRVAIARVILKDSPILVLDEATSHLDTASERLVQAALSRLFSGRTSFVIAHRLSTVLAADLIVVVDRGRIVECGAHEELLNAGGLYARLYALQFQNALELPSPAGETPLAV